jgi:hypothetical protein
MMRPSLKHDDVAMNRIEPGRTAPKRRRQIGLHALLLIGVAFLAGCVSPNAANQVKNFSNALTLTASNATQAYQLVEKAYFDKQLSEAVVKYCDGTDVNLDSFHPDAFKVFFPTNEIQVRLDVLTGLTTYAAQLSTLMENPTVSNLDQDTTKLGQSLTNLNQDLVTAAFLQSNTVTSTELQIFTAGVNFIGNWLITRKEQKEAKQSIDDMQTNVPQICRVLQKDFGYLRKELTNDCHFTQFSARVYYEKNFNHLDPFQRRAEIEHMVALSKEMETADAALAGTQELFGKLALAHQALSEAFTKDTSNLKSLIGEVSGEGQRVAAYYNSLRTNN